METKIDAKFTAHVEELLKRKEEKLFTWGCCFHFARILHLERGIPFIEGILGRTFEGSVGYDHVWVFKDRIAIDGEGPHDREFLGKAMGIKYPTSYVRQLKLSEIEAKIDAKPLPPAVLSEVYARARSYFDSNPLFSTVRGTNKAI